MTKFRDFGTFPAGDLVPIHSGDGTGFDAVSVDSPTVVVDTARPNGDFFMMWYEGQEASGGRGIGFVTSTASPFPACGTCISRRAAVLPTDATAPGALYDDGATAPTVVLDPRPGEQPNARYKMWFEGRSGANGATSSIVYCESGDGENWTNFTVCTGLAPGTNVSFGTRVGDPCVVLDQSNGGDRFQMWFEAIDEAGTGASQIGYADSADGVAWIVRDAGVGTSAGAVAVFVATMGGPFTAFSVGSPTVVLIEDFNDNNLAYHLWYTAGDVAPAAGTEETIGYATSANGRSSWFPEGSLTPQGLPVLVPTSDTTLDPATSGLEWDSGNIRQPAAWINTGLPETVDGAFLIWYTGIIENGGPGAPRRIGVSAGRRP
jgi:hypothetical protein